jgi:iron complex outermembrane receptor protein
MDRLLFALPLVVASAANGVPPVIDVGEVTVTATRSERDVLEVPGNVTIIDRQTIEQSQARDVPELLRREAGIFVTNTTTNPDGYLIDARGFNDGGGNGSSLLVLRNGQRLNDPDSSSPDWSVLRLGNVERIEVMRGPASALYGDGAVSGVVNVITRSPDGPPEVEILGASGTYDTTLVSGFVRGNQGPLSASLFVDRPSTQAYRDQAAYRAYLVEGAARYELGERVVVGVDSGWSSDQRNRPGAIGRDIMNGTSPLCGSVDCGRRAANPLVDDDDLHRRRFYVDGLISAELADAVGLELRPFYRSRSDDGQITNPPDAVFDQNTDTDSVGVGAKLQIDRPVLTFTNRLIVGLDVLSEDVDVDSISTSSFGDFPARSDTSRHLYGVFAQNELDLTGALRLSLGTRYDYARLRAKDRLALPGAPDTFRYKTKFWSPKASLVYRLAEPASVYAAYSKGFRVPNVDEAFGFFGFNPGLDAEKSDTYETGLKLRGARLPWLPFESRAAFNLALYWMRVDDQILFDHELEGSFGPAPRNVNIDRVRHRGIETSFDVFLAERLELYGSYTFDDTQIQRDRLTDLEGKRLPITPKHSGSVGVRLVLPHALETGLNANFVGQRYAANDLSNEFRKLSSYETFDATFAFRPNLTEKVQLHLGLMIRNLFDREYSAFAGERTFVRGDPALPGDGFGYFPSPDRNWQVAFGLTFRP